MTTSGNRAKLKHGIEGPRVSVFRIPTEGDESDGTLAWNSTTLIWVELPAQGAVGVGYTYADASVAAFIADNLFPLLEGAEPGDIPGIWERLYHTVRNQGRGGLATMAISAVDVALWDLKAKLLDLPLATLLGRLRESVPIYGSGGFTSYSHGQLQSQLERWTEREGIQAVKIKVGRDLSQDGQRAQLARQAIGADPKLFVDANSAYVNSKQALLWMHRFADECDATWMEQPLDPHDLDGLRLLRQQGPAKMDVTDGEYGWDLPDFRRFLEAGAVDVLMVDASRCGGITGVQRVAALSQAFHVPLSTHCAPTLHLHLSCSLPGLLHCEYFHDHARIEAMLFEGFESPRNGHLTPDLSRPGMGIELKRQDAAPYQL